MSEAMMWLMARGVWETVAMTLVSGFLVLFWGCRSACCYTPPVRGKLSPTRNFIAGCQPW